MKIDKNYVKFTVVEFAIKSFDKAMRVATYKTSKEMPNKIKRVLPDTDEFFQYDV